MIKKVVDLWEQDDDMSVCPHCGSECNCMRVEEDDGYDMEGHWTDWTFECLSCGKTWVARWYLTSPTIREELA